MVSLVCVWTVIKPDHIPNVNDTHKSAESYSNKQGEY